MSHHTCGLRTASCFQCIEDKLHGEKIVEARTAAKLEASKFALLANDIVMAAEAWAYAVGLVSNPAIGFAPKAQDLVKAVAAYQKARSEDERR